MRYHYMHEIFKKNNSKKNEIDCTNHYNLWYKCIKLEKRYDKIYRYKNINIIKDCNELKDVYLDCLKKVDNYEKTQSI